MGHPHPAANTEKVHLTQEKETLLPALYGKALDSRAASPILGDTFADDVVRRLDYDFEKLDMPKGAAISLPVRAKHLDGWTRDFLAANADAIVLHLGCGLDSRILRVDPPPSVRWFDVDHPEVIELRRRLYPERRGYTMIGSSVTDLRWLEQIPSDGPVLVVAEGLVIYLREPEGLALFRAITQKFPRGELIFDSYSRLMLRLTARLPAVRKTGAVLSWGIDDPHEIEQRAPGLKLVEAVPFMTLPELVSRLAPSRLGRLLLGWMARSTTFNRLVQHLRYRF